MLALHAVSYWSLLESSHQITQEKDHPDHLSPYSSIKV